MWPAYDQHGRACRLTNVGISWLGTEHDPWALLGLAEFSFQQRMIISIQGRCGMSLACFPVVQDRADTRRTCSTSAPFCCATLQISGAMMAEYVTLGDEISLSFSAMQSAHD